MTMTQTTLTAKACLAGAALALLGGIVPAAAQEFTPPTPMPALASGASADGITAQAATPITEYLGGGYMGFCRGM